MYAEQRFPVSLLIAASIAGRQQWTSAAVGGGAGGGGVLVSIDKQEEEQDEGGRGSTLAGSIYNRLVVKLTDCHAHYCQRSAGNGGKITKTMKRLY